jgi:putative endonuclease
MLVTVAKLPYGSAMHEGDYYVYIVASRSRTLYIGVTGNLHKRVFEHRRKVFAGFSADYNCNRLVWFEGFVHASSAIAREKQLKRWTRAKKIALIEKTNLTWEDLSEGWYTPEQLDPNRPEKAGPSTSAAFAASAQDDSLLDSNQECRSGEDKRR